MTLIVVIGGVNLNLTLTRVVFEFGKWGVMSIDYKNLTLTRVVFE